MPTPSLYPTAAPVRRPDGRMVCPMCRAWLSKYPPDRCPDCLQRLMSAGTIRDEHMDEAGISAAGQLQRLVDARLGDIEECDE